MDKYNLYLNKTYAENVDQLRANMSERKTMITRFKEKFIYQSYVRQRLNVIKSICSETMHRDRILNHFTTRTVLQGAPQFDANRSHATKHSTKKIKDAFANITKTNKTKEPCRQLQFEEINESI